MTDSGSNISMLLTLILSAIVISAPFGYAALLTINWWLLDNKHYMDAFKHKFGALYEHLDLSKGRIVILEPVQLHVLFHSQEITSLSPLSVTSHAVQRNIITSMGPVIIPVHSRLRV